jgi:hypothetical protein
MSTEIEEEVRDALRALVEEIGAVSARIVEHDESRDPADSTRGTGVPARTLALGGGEYLRVDLPTHGERTHDIDAAFERVARQLRTIRRRWEVSRLPEITVAPGVVPTSDRITERMNTFLRALAQIDRASNAFCTRGTKLVASARDPDENESSRWQFLARRALSTHAPGSSHGEVVDPDAYAMSFWYDAALVVLLDEPYGVDFVRHRCRQVARELSNLLPLLEPDPGGPAAIRRRPPTLP